MIYTQENYLNLSFERFETDKLNLIHYIKENNIEELLKYDWSCIEDASLGKELIHYFYQEKRDTAALKFLLDNFLDSDLILNDGWTLFTLAIFNNDAEMSKILFDLEANPNLPNQHGLTPLHYACESKDLEMIAALLDRNADIRPVFEHVFEKADGIPEVFEHDFEKKEEILELFVSKAFPSYFEDILKKACINGNIERLKKLIHLGVKIEADLCWFLLSNAFKSDQLEIVRFFLEAEPTQTLILSQPKLQNNCLMRVAYTVNISKSFILDCLIKKGVKVNDEDASKNTALHYAVSNPASYAYNSVQLLLEKGANPNHQNIFGHTPLHWAYDKKDPWIISLLLKKNASINLQDAEGLSPFFLIQEFQNETEKVTLLKEAFSFQAKIDQQNLKGETPLFKACSLKSEGAVELLLHQGASTEICNQRKWTPLHIACEVGALSCVKQLIQHKANLNAQTRNGNTPLHVACLKKQTEIFKYLLEAGADKMIPNSSGKTVLDLANERNIEEIKEIMEEKINSELP